MDLIIHALEIGIAVDSFRCKKPLTVKRQVKGIDIGQDIIQPEGYLLHGVFTVTLLQFRVVAGGIAGNNNRYAQQKATQNG
jgi:hypothetical protein